jgi:hypothetical protein
MQTKKLARRGGTSLKGLDFNRFSDFDARDLQNNEKPLRFVPERLFCCLMTVGSKPAA